MKTKQTNRLLSLLLALVMLMALAVPAFADDGDGDDVGDGGEGSTKEIRMLGLDWDEEGRNYASDDLLAAADRGEGSRGGHRLAPGNELRVIFFIWNNETEKREKFVVPEAGEGVSVEKLTSDEIAKNAKQSQYYVRMTLDDWKDAELTADGLTFYVTAGMDSYAFFSSQTFSQETYMGNLFNEEKVTDCTVYFGNSYAGTDEADNNDKVVSVEKVENGSENLYTVEKVSDDCWKIVYKDVLAVWDGIGVELKLEVRQPDGETREDGQNMWIYRERAPQLWFVPIDGEWDDEAGSDVFHYNPDRDDFRGNGCQIYGSDYAEIGLFAYGGEWTEDGFNRDGLTPVSVDDLKLPEGVAVDTNVPAAKDAQWAEYYVSLSLDEMDKEYTVSYNEYELTLNSHLPEVGVYTAPKASLETWAGPWEFDFNAVLDNTYYIISTASDAVHGRHLTADIALSADWNKEDEGVANDGAELVKVSDGVYELKLKDSALSRDRFHLELDLDWMDVAGNTYAEKNRYVGDFVVNGAVVAAETALYDGTAAEPGRIPAADAKDKVTNSVTMKAGEDKVLYLYRSAYSGEGPVVGTPLKDFFHSSSEDLTLTQDAADLSKFTLSCAKAGVYEIYVGREDYDWENLKLFHADGKEYTKEEYDGFNELLCDIEDGVLIVYDEDWNPIPFTEKFPGDTYELKSLGRIRDYGWIRLTVTVEPSYVDVKSGDWFYDDVNFVSLKGMMGSASATEQRFSPMGKVKREMVPTVLYRLEGEPEVKAGSFTDVKADAYYANAAAWGAENAIVKGVGNDAFGVGSNITREQLAAMLYRYAEFKGCDMTVSDDLAAFPDAGSVHSWALKEMQWAVGAGIINGKGGSLVPQGEASRAELATMLARFCREVLD